MESEVLNDINKGSWFCIMQIHVKVLGLGAIEFYWCDVNTIQPGKISATISDVSEKQSIDYTPDCIVSAIIEHTNYETNINNHYSNHVSNEDDDAFDNQLEKLGADKGFSNKTESVTRELRTYIEYWEKCMIKKLTKDTALNF